LVVLGFNYVVRLVQVNKMNKKGKIATEILIMLVTIVITSAIIFLLVQADVLQVKDSNSDVSVLNTEFIPMGREGVLNLREFSFCSYIDEEFNCVDPSAKFYLGGEVFFTYIVETGSYNGDIQLVKSYRIVGPLGNTLLDVNDHEDFYFDSVDSEDVEFIAFQDNFFMGEALEPGQYTLELFIDNQLLSKKTKIVKTFEAKKLPISTTDLYYVTEEE
jgi:hypothetical protein